MIISVMDDIDGTKLITVKRDLNSVQAEISYNSMKTFPDLQKAFDEQLDYAIKTFKLIQHEVA